MNHVERALANMVEIKIVGDVESGFYKIVETLTRIGVANNEKKTLWQSCHILHKQGRYYIAHFKEMYQLDGRKADIAAADLGRRNCVVEMLKQWGLIEVISEKQASWPMSSPKSVKVLKHSEKDSWILEPKYAIGKKRVA